MTNPSPTALIDWTAWSATQLPILGVGLFLAAYWLTVAVTLFQSRFMPLHWWRLHLMLVMAVCALGWAKWGVEPHGAFVAWVVLVCIAILGSWLGLVTVAGGHACPGFRLRSVVGVAFSVSLVWVTSYQYQYNVPALNTPYVNQSTLFIWGTCLSSTAAFHRLLCHRGWQLLPRYGLVWVAYMAGLLVLEFIGYHLLAIKEVSKGVLHAPMLFDVVHGPVQMKAFYLVAGVLTAWLDQMYRQAQQARCEKACGVGNTSNLSRRVC